MRKTIKHLQELADRFKVVTGLILLMAAGGLMGGGAVSWHYKGLLHERVNAYERQITRTDKELSEETGINRQMLARVAAELSRVASESSGNTATLALIANDLSNIAKGVSIASRTAKSAANTARIAAKAAAQPKITITEVRPGPALEKRSKAKTQEPGP